MLQAKNERNMLKTLYMCKKNWNPFCTINYWSNKSWYLRIRSLKKRTIHRDRYGLDTGLLICLFQSQLGSYLAFYKTHGFDDRIPKLYLTWENPLPFLMVEDKFHSWKLYIHQVWVKILLINTNYLLHFCKTIFLNFSLTKKYMCGFIIYQIDAITCDGF